MFVRLMTSLAKDFYGRMYGFSENRIYKVPANVGRDLIKMGFANEVKEESIKENVIDYVEHGPRLAIENKEKMFYVVKNINIAYGPASFKPCHPGEIISLSNYRARTFLLNNEIVEVSKIDELINKLNEKTVQDYDKLVNSYSV